MKRFIPYFVFLLLILTVGVVGAYSWEYTNSPEFCGMACHSMPPEYTTYQHSPHAQIKCVECHIGREFIGNQVMHKVSDLRHVIATISQDYEVPITAHNLRPATETCERCHSTEKYSDDTQQTIIHYDTDQNNTPTTTYLRVKTGGGTAEQGLGDGIHWHIENPVFYYATDAAEQDIPYVKVPGIPALEGNDFTLDREYIDMDSTISPYEIDPAELKEMDCVTCHNRISHSIAKPETAVDQALSRNQISPAIPDIRRLAVETLRAPYTDKAAAEQAIAGLTNIYRDEYADFYETNSEDVETAVAILQTLYAESVFPEQKVDWDTYADNLGHMQDPGCFRCHDGKHIEAGGEPIPLNCGLCHAIPVTAKPGDLITNLAINNEPQPISHGSPNWIALHRIAYDPDDPNESCSGCHDTANYDKADDSSFCANSACHGSGWEHLDFTVFDTPEVQRAIVQQLPHYPANLTPIAEWEETPSLDTIHQVQEEMVCEDCHETVPPVAPPKNEMCLACHEETQRGLFNLTSNLEPNPHDGHEGDGSCAFCHTNFGPERDPCSLCHETVAVVPVETLGN